MAIDIPEQYQSLKTKLETIVKKTSSQWNSQSVTNGTLYYNTALRLCDFYYYRTGFTPSSTSSVTIASAIIPSAYRPKGSVKVSFYNPGQGGYIATDGDLIGWFSSTASQAVNCSATWHY